MAADLRQGECGRGAPRRAAGRLRRALASSCGSSLIRDRARSALDLEAIRARGDFSAELLTRAEALLADPDALDGFLAEHARPTDRRLRNLAEADAAETDRATMAAALDEALDRLEPDE